LLQETVLAFAITVFGSIFVARNPGISVADCWIYSDYQQSLGAGVEAHWWKRFFVQQQQARRIDGKGCCLRREGPRRCSIKLREPAVRRIKNALSGLDAGDRAGRAISISYRQ